MTRGQVKWFDPKKGYGFIIGPEGQDVFVHYSHIDAEGFKALKNGEWVDYELVQGDKGWQARAVKGTGQIAEDSGANGGAPGAGGSAAGPSAGQGRRDQAPRPRSSGYSSGGGGGGYSSGGGYSGGGGSSRASGGYSGGYEAGPGKRQDEEEV